MSTATVAAAPSSSNQSTGAELRVRERFQCSLQTSCQPIAARGDHDVTWSARVRDISASGVGLVLGRRFEPGAGLAIEIPDTPTSPGETLLAKVRHATRLPSGEWLHGCAFVSELSDDEIQSLLCLAESQRAEAARNAAAAEAARQPPAPPAPPEKDKKTWLIPQVLLVSSVPGKPEARRLVPRLFMTGSWPLATGTILKVRLGRENSPEAKLRVSRCYQQDNRWIVHYTFLSRPAPEMLRWFGWAE